METPEPVENAKKRFGSVEFEVDDRLSHVVIDGEKMEFSYLEYYDGEWSLTVYDGRDIMLQFPLSEIEVEWIYDSDVPEKAERAEELLEEAQALLDDIWGEKGDTSAEELTKRVDETRRKLKRNYL
jgi:hypothetical protein